MTVANPEGLIAAYSRLDNSLQTLDDTFNRVCSSFAEGQQFVSSAGGSVTWSGSASVARKGHTTALVLGSIRQTPDSKNQRSSANDAEILLKVYSEYQVDAVNHFTGTYCLLLMDGDSLLAATDRFSTQQLYYAPLKEGFLVSTDLRLLLEHPAVDIKVSAQAIYDYVYFHMVPSPQCVFEGIYKVPPGCLLLVKNGRLTTGVTRYWKPQFNESAHQFDKHSGSVLDLLGSAVEEAATDQRNVGSFLSGGLDSSTVTGLLARASGGKAPAFTIGFDEEGYDETPFARSAAEHFGVKLIEYYAQPGDISEIVQLISKAYAEPFGNSSAVPAYCCARRAREEGVNLLLAGDGGDELFAGNTRYAVQQLFEIWGKLPRQMRESFFDPVIRSLPQSFRWFRRAKSYVEQAEIPLPDRIQGAYNFVNRPELANLFSNKFLEMIDSTLPLSLERNVFSEPEDASALNRMLYLDWKFTLADNDLLKVSRMCSLAGVAVAYPMLDDRLVDFSCQIPSRQKLRFRKLRYYFRKEVQDFLPKSVLHKSKHGFGLPFGLWMNTEQNLRNLVSDSISSLERRGIFTEAALRNVVRLHRESHASYYGELIWLLMVLELWLQETESRFKIQCSF